MGALKAVRFVAEGWEKKKKKVVYTDTDGGATSIGNRFGFSGGGGGGRALVGVGGFATKGPSGYCQTHLPANEGGVIGKLTLLGSIRR